MKNLILVFAMILLPAAGFAQGGTAGSLEWSAAGNHAVQTAALAQAENPDGEYLLPSSGTYKIRLSRNPTSCLAESAEGFASFGLGIPFLDVFPESLMPPDANATFYVEAIEEGQYVIVSGYEKTEPYLRGRFLFNAAELASQDDRYLLHGRWTRFAFAEAIRVDNRLYVLGSAQVTDLSQLEALVQAGAVQEIDLTADNRFAFAFRLFEAGSTDFFIQSGREGAAGGGWITMQMSVPVLVENLSQDVPEFFILEPAAEGTSVLSVSSSSLSFDAEGETQNLTVTANTGWTAAGSESWLTVSPASGANDGTVSVTAAANTGAARTAAVTVTGGGITHTVTVTQEAVQGIQAEPTPPVDGRGTLDIALNLSPNESFSLSFILSLPAGFVLDPDATSLAPGLQNGYQLSIDPNGPGGWLFEITPKLSLLSGGETARQQVVNIAYTLDETVAVGGHEVKLHDIDLTRESGTTQRLDDVGMFVTVDENSVGVETVEPWGIVYGSGILSVNTPAAEQVEVYSVGGQLLFRVQKAVCEATFDLSGLPRGVLIVRGSSGWVQKIVNK